MACCAWHRSGADGARKGRRMDTLFAADLPQDFRYCEEFISAVQEQTLLDAIGAVEFAEFKMRGVVARLLVAFFGESYDRAEARPLPEFLLPLRDSIAAWAGLDAAAFAMALINEYRPGAPIGWHRDAPQYDVVAGVSLLSAARMKLRPYVAPKDIRLRASASAGQVPMLPGPRKTTHEIELQPRSAYLMTGESR